MSLSVLTLVSTMICNEILFRTRLPLSVRRLPHCGNPFLFHGVTSYPFLGARPVRDRSLRDNPP